MLKALLLVEPDLDVLAALRRDVEGLAEVDTASQFFRARSQLLQHPPDLLVTNVRLREYNGLHLVLLAASLPTRCVVYVTHHDAGLAWEAQRLGAFYERMARIASALPSYLQVVLPSRDRRSVTRCDRRQVFRTGRRVTDTDELFAGPAQISRKLTT